MTRAVCTRVLLWVAAVSAEAGPPTRTTLFENDRVAVAEVVFAPGDEEPEHSHANDMVGIAITGGLIESTSPDGKLSRLGGKPGDVFFLAKGSSHRTRNVSSERVVFRVILLK